MMRCKEKIVITLPLLGRMCFIQISFEQFNHRWGDWDYSQFISLSSKADCCMSFSNDQVMNFCIHQFLTTCCGVVHQPHKTEITISMLDTLEDMGYDVERLRPEGKDWNDDLRAKRGGHG